MDFTILPSGYYFIVANYINLAKALYINTERVLWTIPTILLNWQL